MSEDAARYFNEVYDKEYNRIVRFVVTRSNRLEDVQDIVQDVFVEFYSVVERKGERYIDNAEALLIKIAKRKLSRYYSLMTRLRMNISINSEEKSEDVPEIEDREINDKIDNEITCEEVYKIIKSKPQEVQKAFYMFYYLDMTIREISDEMKLGESNVKHKIYRTLEEIRNIYKGW